MCRNLIQSRSHQLIYRKSIRLAVHISRIVQLFQLPLIQLRLQFVSQPSLLNPLRPTLLMYLIPLLRLFHRNSYHIWQILAIRVIQAYLSSQSHFAQNFQYIQCTRQHTLSIQQFLATRVDFLHLEERSQLKFRRQWRSQSSTFTLVVLSALPQPGNLNRLKVLVLLIEYLTHLSQTICTIRSANPLYQHWRSIQRSKSVV